MPHPPASNPASKAVPDDRLIFPPFPTPPPGVTITPFKDFKENGIQIFATNGDDVERDGFGIPTIPLRVRHDTDMCKTETKRAKTAAKVEKAKSSLAPGVKREWWEEWTDAEDTRLGGPYNPHTSPLDRLYEAATDFRKGRPWPRSILGISANWDQFRLFIGMLSNTPVWTRTDKPAPEDESDSDDEDELEAEAEQSAQDSTMHVVEGQVDCEPRKFKRLRARPPYALYGLEPVPVSSDAEVKTLFEVENARREEEMIDFLNDPEGKVKIFLSSYMRKQGLIWYDRNLINMPRLVGFFLNFLLRNRVFPESHFERGFRRSLEIVNIAQKELILTSKLSKELPDKFSKAAKNCWGQKADGYKPSTTEDSPETNIGAIDVDMENDSNGAKPELSEDQSTKKTAIEKFEADLKAANMQIINVADDIVMKEGETLQVLQDNLDPATDAVPQSTWGTSDWGESPWGDSKVAEPAWGNWGSTDGKVDSNTWAAPVIDWAPSDIDSMIPLMGPTALPNTHTTGIVEWSVRRIKSITPPPSPATLLKSPVSGDGPEEDPDAVDIELERRFAKVVLEPWIGWDREEVPHLAHPRILETSRGPVAGVTKEDGRVETYTEAAGVVPAGGGIRSHDPSKDDITLFVDPDTLPVFNVGLGLGGTWVQMVRPQDIGLEGTKKKKKKKSKSKQAPQRYWYIDELLMILPSYYT